MTFSALSFCGIIFVFCKAMAVNAPTWVSLGLLFFPFLVSSIFLLPLGILITRMYRQQLTKVSFFSQQFWVEAMDLASSVSCVSFPPLALFLVIWIALGIFFFLKEMPILGGLLNIVLAFGPFLLILSSILLCFFGLALLFFLTPFAAKAPIRGYEFAKEMVHSLKRKPLIAMALCVVGLLPSVCVAWILTLSASLTNDYFSKGLPSTALGLEWFFIMLPFCALLAPTVIFFFHFASESEELLQGL